MRFLLAISIALLGLSQLSNCAKINSEHDSVAMVESVKQQLKQLESEVTKGYQDEKLQWQLEIFQKWYQDTQKCSRDLSYIFGDWTTIQRRIDGSEDFNRNWTDYRQGFGDKQGEFFIGLDNLHAATTEKDPQELLILLGDNEGKMAYAKYDGFLVAGAEEKYELQELGKYSGSAGDSLRHHVGKKFSTFDEDNDNSRRNCAKVSKGAWWFSYCFESFLNAPYLHSSMAGESPNGMIWEAWHGSSYSLNFAQMMIRPKK